MQLARPPEPMTIAQHVSYQMRTHFVPRWSFFPPPTAAEVRAAFTIISPESPADNPVGFLTLMFTAWAYLFYFNFILRPLLLWLSPHFVFLNKGLQGILFQTNNTNITLAISLGWDQTYWGRCKWMYIGEKGFEFNLLYSSALNMNIGI